jgi:hypothetical protein
LKVSRWTGIALGVLLQVATSHVFASDDVAVVARVGRQVITADELSRELQQRMPRRDPGTSAEVERQSVLDDLIGRKLLVQAAIDAGYLDDPGVRYALEGLLVQRYRSDHVDPALATIAITSQEVETFYQGNREIYQIAPQRRAAVLQLTSTGDDAFARAQVARERAQALSSADGPVANFGALAAELSHDRATRYRGGDMGALVPGVEYRWPAAVVAAAFALREVGEVSEPIAANGYLWLVRLTTLEAESFRPISAVAATIRHELVRQRQAQLIEERFSALRAEIAVDIDAGALAAVKPPPPLMPPSLPSDSGAP